MIDMTCRLCAGSGVYDFSFQRKTCGMCQGMGNLLTPKQCWWPPSSWQRSKREPVIEVVMGLVLQVWMLEGRESGERFKAAQAFNAPGHNLLRYGWDVGALCPMRV